MKSQYGHPAAKDAKTTRRTQKKTEEFPLNFFAPFAKPLRPSRPDVGLLERLHG
jgi:hypothetical protein